MKPKTKVIIDLTNLWAIVVRESEEELKPYLAAIGDYERLANELEPLRSKDRHRKKQENLRNATTAKEIEQLAQSLAVAGHLSVEKLTAEAVHQKLKAQQAKVNQTVPPILATARRIAARVRETIRASDAEYFEQFGVPARSTHLVSYVEQFEKSIAAIEERMTLMADHFSPPFPTRIPGTETPRRPQAEPIIDLSNPSVSPILRRAEMDIQSQRIDSEVDRVLLERLRSKSETN